jgi:hypothetical protein
MNLIYILVVVLVGVFFLSPLLFVKRTWLKVLIMVVALAAIGVAIPLTQQYLYPHYAAYRFEKDLQQQPLFQIIAKNHPKEYADFINTVKQNYEKNEGNKTATLAANLVNRIFLQYLQKAPNEYVGLYLKATIAFYDYLYSVDPSSVIHFEQGNPLINSGKMQEILEKEEFKNLLSRLLESKRYLIEATLKSSMPIPKEEEAKPLLNVVLQKLIDQYGEKAVATMFSKGGNPDESIESSKLIISFYKQIQGEGEEKAGIMMRYLATLKNQALQKSQSENKKDKP